MSASENLSIKLPFEKGYLLIDYKGDNEELNSLKFTSLDLDYQIKLKLSFLKKLI